MIRFALKSVLLASVCLAAAGSFAYKIVCPPGFCYCSEGSSACCGAHSCSNAGGSCTCT
jgi:hypothetical protein